MHWEHPAIEVGGRDYHIDMKLGTGVLVRTLKRAR